eukprot:TRINITY_DN61758_c0_g1_i1.p1 TRINITY_DN61758_c0_g1~~TRINITY_DN61758_c0_g1_i1.p1  ORF type:complete len:638 (+),score=107.43 TRINITY_DN61758_c0_g1_i1:160-2073(+)
MRERTVRIYASADAATSNCPEVAAGGVGVLGTHASRPPPSPSGNARGVGLGFSLAGLGGTGFDHVFLPGELQGLIRPWTLTQTSPRSLSPLENATGSVRLQSRLASTAPARIMLRGAAEAQVSQASTIAFDPPSTPRTSIRPQRGSHARPSSVMADRHGRPCHKRPPEVVRGELLRGLGVENIAMTTSPVREICATPFDEEKAMSLWDCSDELCTVKHRTALMRKHTLALMRRAEHLDAEYLKERADISLSSKVEPALPGPCIQDIEDDAELFARAKEASAKPQIDAKQEFTEVPFVGPDSPGALRTIDDDSCSSTKSTESTSFSRPTPHSTASAADVNTAVFSFVLPKSPSPSGVDKAVPSQEGGGGASFKTLSLGSVSKIKGFIKKKERALPARVPKINMDLGSNDGNVKQVFGSSSPSPPGLSQNQGSGSEQVEAGSRKEGSLRKLAGAASPAASALSQTSGVLTAKDRSKKKIRGMMHLTLLGPKKATQAPTKLVHVVPETKLFEQNRKFVINEGKGTLGIVSIYQNAQSGDLRVRVSLVTMGRTLEMVVVEERVEDFLTHCVSLDKSSKKKTRYESVVATVEASKDFDGGFVLTVSGWGAPVEIVEEENVSSELGRIFNTKKFKHDSTVDGS